MTGRDAGLVVRALGSRLDLATRQTQYRGHAGKLAAESAAEGYELVITTSWVTDKGLETTNWAVLDALDMAHISESTRFVRFKSPDLKTAQAGG